MKQKTDSISSNVILLDSKNSGVELEELRRSHSVLQSLIALIPSDTRSEFVELLESLAHNERSLKVPNPERRRALQIVEEVCRQEHPDREVARHEMERRVGERRKADRRQRQPNNYGRPWTQEQIQTLQVLARQNTPIRRIALKLGRTSTAIQSKAKEMDLPLKLIS
ncbi:MAG TPA: hypothetical protein VIU43_03155 [Nitrosospira sp.]